jgi:hypothetical protein
LPSISPRLLRMNYPVSVVGPINTRRSFRLMRVLGLILCQSRMAQPLLSNALQDRV